MADKTVTVFFDFEEWWESQCRRRFDVERSMKGISGVLDENGVKAVFNTCGIVVETFPKIIKGLHKNGHEIASHGYAHENFIQLQQMNKLDSVLGRTEKIIERAIGERPVGVRPPWLFANEDVYATIEKRGYKWISNYSVFRSEVMDNPTTPASFKTLKRVFYGLHWARAKRAPFRTGALIEIPLLSSQDGELLSVVDPGQETPRVWIDFAYDSLRKQFDRSGSVFNLNFHPWLIGTANRTQLLSRILEYARKKGAEFVLAKDLLARY